MFRSLRIRNYRLWFTGALVSNIGTWMQRTAQSWLVFDELTDHDSTAMGVVMALQFVPQLLLAPYAGVLADRYDRRRILVLTQGIMALLARINEGGTTVVMATHDDTIVDAMRRRVIELDDGVVQRDEARAVYGAGR